jgi:hypothetical protein
MSDLNLHEFPAGGGWVFRQPQTGWVNPMAMVGFDASIKSIIQHRNQNKAITLKHRLSTNYEAVKMELIQYTRQRLGLPNPSPPSFFRQSRSLPERVVAAAADIKRAAQGTGVVLDWIQAGGEPELQERAEKRAEICVACQKNVPGAWFTEAPAQLLKEAIEGWQSLKGNNFEFVTKQGDALKSCDVCKCLMRLKVFTPLSHILSRTPSAILSEFPPNCWITKRDA